MSKALNAINCLIYIYLQIGRKSVICARVCVCVDGKREEEEKEEELASSHIYKHHHFIPLTKMCVLAQL